MNVLLSHFIELSREQSFCELLFPTAKWIGANIRKGTVKTANDISRNFDLDLSCSRHHVIGQVVGNRLLSLRDNPVVNVRYRSSE